MPNAVTHILIPLVILSIFRHHVFKRKNFPLYLVLIGGIAGLLPDIDILFIWLFNIDIHRLFTHSFVIPIVLGVIGFGVYKFKAKIGRVFWVVAFGMSVHIALDLVLAGSVVAFWPVYSVSYGLNLLPGTLFKSTLYAGIDAILLGLWLIYEYWQHNIKDYT